MSLVQSSFSYFPRNHKDDSILISFEGIEGAGKSTQIQLLKTYLESKDYQVVLMREPGGTALGESLRELILGSDKKIHPLSETLMFLTSRNELIVSKILPLLTNNKKMVIILDRYIDSTLSYQGFGRELGTEEILKLHSVPPLNLLPHKTFYLKINEETSRLRQKKRGQDLDYFEKETSKFYQAINNGFNTLAEIFHERILTIDATKDLENVHRQIVNAWEQNFS